MPTPFQVGDRITDKQGQLATVVSIANNDVLIVFDVEQRKNDVSTPSAIIEGAKALGITATPRNWSGYATSVAHLHYTKIETKPMPKTKKTKKQTFQIGDRVKDQDGTGVVVAIDQDVCVVYDRSVRTAPVSVPDNISDVATKLGLTATGTNWGGWLVDVASSHYTKLKPISKFALNVGDRILVGISYNGKRDVVPATVIEDTIDTGTLSVLLDKSHAFAGAKNPKTDPTRIDNGIDWDDYRLQDMKTAAKKLGLKFNANRLTTLPGDTNWGGIDYSDEVLAVIPPTLTEGDYAELIGEGVGGIMLDESTMACQYKGKGAVLLTAEQKEKAIKLGAIKPKYALKLTDQSVRKTNQPVYLESLSIGDEIEFIDCDGEEHKGTVVEVGYPFVAWVKSNKGGALSSNAWDEGELLEYQAKKLGLKRGYYAEIDVIKSIIKKAPPASPKIKHTDLKVGDKITYSDGCYIQKGTIVGKQGSLWITTTDDTYAGWQIDDMADGAVKTRLEKSIKELGFKSDEYLETLSKDCDILEIEGKAEPVKTTPHLNIGDKITVPLNGSDVSGVVVGFDKEGNAIAVVSQYDPNSSGNYGVGDASLDNICKLANEGLANHGYWHLVSEVKHIESKQLEITSLKPGDKITFVYNGEVATATFLLDHKLEGHLFELHQGSDKLRNHFDCFLDDKIDVNTIKSLEQAADRFGIKRKQQDHMMRVMSHMQNDIRILDAKPGKSVAPPKEAPTKTDKALPFDLYSLNVGDRVVGKGESHGKKVEGIVVVKAEAAHRKMPIVWTDDTDGVPATGFFDTTAIIASAKELGLKVDGACFSYLLDCDGLLETAPPPTKVSDTTLRNALEPGDYAVGFHNNAAIEGIVLLPASKTYAGCPIIWTEQTDRSSAADFMDHREIEDAAEKFGLTGGSFGYLHSCSSVVKKYCAPLLLLKEGDKVSVPTGTETVEGVVLDTKSALAILVGAAAGVAGASLLTAAQRKKAKALGHPNAKYGISYKEAEMKSKKTTKSTPASDLKLGDQVRFTGIDGKDKTAWVVITTDQDPDGDVVLLVQGEYDDFHIEDALCEELINYNMKRLGLISQNQRDFAILVSNELVEIVQREIKPFAPVDPEHLKRGDKIKYTVGGSVYQGTVVLEACKEHDAYVVLEELDDPFEAREVDDQLATADVSEWDNSDEEFERKLGRSLLDFGFALDDGTLTRHLDPNFGDNLQVLEVSGKTRELKGRALEAFDLDPGDQVELRLFYRNSEGKKKSKKVKATCLTGSYVLLDKRYSTQEGSSYALKQCNDSEKDLLIDALDELDLNLKDSDDRLWQIEDHDTEIIKVLKRATAPQQKDTTMSEDKTEKSFMDTLKEDMGEAGYRIAQTQMTTGVKNAVVMAITAKGGGGEKAEMLKAFFDSKWGEVTIAMMLGQGLEHIPGLESDPRIAKLASEFRRGSLTTAGNEVVGGLMEFVVPAIKDAMQHLPPLPEKAGTGVRVKAPPKLVDTHEEATEEAKNVQAIGQRR